MKGLRNLSLLVGIASMLYCLVILLYAGTSIAFVWFWLVIGILGISAGLVFHFLFVQGIAFPIVLLRLVWGMVGLAAVIFLLVEGLILSGAIKKAAPGADYLIVLGAQVRGTRITKPLHYRLEVAFTYLEENPDTKVVVSGGQGSGEDISEAEAMEQYLLEKGISSERILVENRSVNTAENIRFSHALIKEDRRKAGIDAEEEFSVVVATNNFHVFRALGIAKKQGISCAGGLAARSDKVLVLSYYVRECLAIIKDFLVGNI